MLTLFEQLIREMLRRILKREGKPFSEASTERHIMTNHTCNTFYYSTSNKIINVFYEQPAYGFTSRQDLVRFN